jgi:ABC-type uncharacterized transport system substrate-binding protein
MPPSLGRMNRRLEKRQGPGSPRLPRTSRLVLVSALLAGGAHAASAHPHVFVEPHMEVSASPEGHLRQLRNVWRFDEMFSSSIVVDFDRNGNGRLDVDELAAVGRQVRGSIQRWAFYTAVHAGGATVKLVAAPVLGVSWDARSGQLVLDFTMRSETPVDLKTGDVSFSNFDDT